MKYLGLLVVVFLFAGCTSLDKEATKQLYWNVDKVTNENDSFIKKDTELADSVKDAKHLRNAETRIMSWEMAKTAGNKEDSSELGGIGQRPAPYVVPDPADEE